MRTGVLVRTGANGANGCERVLPTRRCERKLVPVQKLGLELVPVQELGRGEVFWARNLKESDNHWRKGCLLLDEEERGEPVFFKGNAPRNRPDQNGELQSAYPTGKAYPIGNCTTKCTNPTAAHPITTTEKCKRISANGKSISVFPLKSTILIMMIMARQTRRRGECSPTRMASESMMRR